MFAPHETLRHGDDSVPARVRELPPCAKLTRLTRIGDRVGEPVRLDGALADVGSDMMEVEAAWSGDRFVIVYGPVVAGATRLRTVGMRRGGGDK